MIISHSQRHWLVILVSFLIAFLLQIIPWPEEILFFRPNWVFLILLYWTLAIPHFISIGTSFMIGGILDLISGSTLGIRSLTLSVIAYLISKKFQPFRNFTLLEQALMTMQLSLFANFIVFFIKFLIINISFQLIFFYSSVVDFLLWPWISLLMNKIHRYSLIQ